MARPLKQVTFTPEQLVELMAEKQCPKVEVAAKLGISIDTFDRRYAEVYSAHKQFGKAKLRQQLFKMAMAGNAQVAIFLGKTVLGLKETSALELSGPDGQAIEMNSSNARERIASKLARMSSAHSASGSAERSDGE